MKKIILISVLLVNAFLGFSQTRSDSIAVLNYHITLEITDFTHKKITGFTAVELQAKQDQISRLRLDLMQLEVDSVTDEAQHHLTFTQSDKSVHINLFQPIDNGNLFTLKIYYHGTPHSDSGFGGFYFTNETAFNMGVSIDNIPHNYGKTWFPCYDTFTDKASYRFSIITADHHKAVCNGLLTDSLFLDDGKIQWNWTMNEVIPTYLAAVAVGNFTTLKDTVQGLNAVIPIEIYVSSNLVSKAPGTFAHLKENLHTFEAAFGAYPYPKIGYVAVPFSAGAMEHASLITFPAFAVDGTLNYETLIAHELAHSWFGNLVTTDKAEEMWINEGFSRFSEALALKSIYPDKDYYFQAVKNLRINSLLNAAKKDRGYWALDSVPQFTTYGTTSYEKGGLVAAGLYAYMGETSFNQAIKTCLHHYQFKNINSRLLCDCMSESFGEDLTPFFEAWVYQPGFLHFSIDSMKCINESSKTYQIYFKQKKYQARHFGNAQKVEVTFFSTAQDTVTLEFKISGESEMKTTTLPFHPQMAIVDFYEKTPVSVLRYNDTVKNSGAKDFTSALIRLQTTQIETPVLVSVAHHWATPDALKSHQGISKISSTHYWSIGLGDAGNFDAQLRFKLSFGENELDQDLYGTNYRDSLVLLYRKNAGEDWCIIPSSLIGSVYITANHIQCGEYTLGIGDRSLAVPDIFENRWTVYPNPVKDQLFITTKQTQPDRVEIYDISGKLVYHSSTVSDVINVEFLPSGVYFLKCFSKIAERVQKFIKL